MYRISQILSIAALLFFCYAQVQGMTPGRFFNGGSGNSLIRGSGNYHK